MSGAEISRSAGDERSAFCVVPLAALTVVGLGVFVVAYAVPFGPGDATAA